MNLEYIRNINGYDEHAIRLSDFDSGQAMRLRNTIERMVEEGKGNILLSTLDFIQAVNCTLILRTAPEDAGITTVDNKSFFCDLTTGSYKHLLELMEPFCRKESKGYQWLYDIDTPIGFLFSAGKDLPEK